MPTKKLVNKIKSSESTISMILGVVVVLVVGVMLFNYFRGNPQNISLDQVKNAVKTEFQSDKAEEKPSGELLQTNLPQKYTVKGGDSLWKISQNIYGSGYNWVDISRENKLTNPGLIVPGQTLTIPNVPAKKETVAGVFVKKPITDNSYTVVRGDNLWNISVRAYQDGFKWPEITKANRYIVNPRLIHPGNVLVIPR